MVNWKNLKCNCDNRTELLKEYIKTPQIVQYASYLIIENQLVKSRYETANTDLGVFEVHRYDSSMEIEKLTPIQNDNWDYIHINEIKYSGYNLSEETIDKIIGKCVVLYK